MFLTGLLYLVFEETIARRSGRPVSALGARALMGVQVWISLLKLTAQHADPYGRWA